MVLVVKWGALRVRSGFALAWNGRGEECGCDCANNKQYLFSVRVMYFEGQSIGSFFE